MSLLQEFKAFAVKGNMIDMAVGIIIGAAFGKIVSSLVGDVIMPPLGILMGGVDFDLAITLKAAEGDLPAVVLSYGKFIRTHHRLHHHRLRHLHRHQGDQQAQARGGSRPGRTAGADQGPGAAQRDPRSAQGAATSRPARRTHNGARSAPLSFSLGLWIRPVRPAA